MADKMTRSEAIEMLRVMVDKQSYSPRYGALDWMAAVRDLLDAEDDPHDPHHEATGIPAPDYDPNDVAFKRPPRLVPVDRIPPIQLVPGDEVSILGKVYRIETNPQL